MKKLILILIMVVPFYANAQPIEEQLEEVVAKAISIAEKTGEFVIEQAPDLLREFYAWKMVENGMAIVISLAFLFISLILFIKSKNEDFDDEWGALGVLAFIVIITSLVPLFIHTFDLVFLLVAPKLYLIEYFVK